MYIFPIVTGTEGSCHTDFYFIHSSSDFSDFEQVWGFKINKKKKKEKAVIDILKLNSSVRDTAFHNQNLLRIFIKKWNRWSNKP